MLLKCASYNFNGLRLSPERKSIFYVLKQKQYDIVFFQETHYGFTNETLRTCQWGDKLVFSHGKK